jgi:hypothetical protein
MACITSLEQNSLDGKWVGKDIRTNREYPFSTLADFRQYTKSLEEQGTYCAPVTPVYNTQYTPGENPQRSGFMEFQPRDPAKQAKHSAMSPTWEGIASSEAAIARGDYDLDMAEKNRSDLRAKGAQPKLKMPGEEPKAAPAWNCSIQ